MPRAYCSKCGAEVPVDDEGRCHVGHEVDLAASTGDEDLAAAARGLEAEFEERHPDEPEPWVAEVEDTFGDTSTPPPVGDEGPGGVPRDADEDLEPAEHPRATLPGESDGWQPPTADPAGPGPQPPPEPAAPPEEIDDDFGLDDLEAAVAELEVEVEGRDEPAAEPPDTSWDDEPEDEERRTADHEAADREEAELDERAEVEEPADEPAPADEDGDEQPSREIDLSNFTASGGKVGEGGGKRGLFGFGR